MMNKKELKENLINRVSSSLKNINEAIKVSTDDNEIYDEETGETVAEILDDATVQFRKWLSPMEKQLYKEAILKNKRLCNWWYINANSFPVNESVNESRTFDPKNNKQHKEAYNSFVKWYNRWKEKLGREEIRALVKKVSNDALGDNLDVINESLVPGLEDEHLAERIFLTFMHTREIYESFTELLVKSLAKKIRKGVELSQDYLANSSIVEKITKAAIDEEKRASGERFIVNTATRKAAKQKIAENLILRAHDEVDYEDQ